MAIEEIFQKCSKVKPITLLVGQILDRRKIFVFVGKGKHVALLFSQKPVCCKGMIQHQRNLLLFVSLSAPLSDW